MDFKALRTDYNDKSNIFLENHIEVKDPIVLFNKWFKEVKDNSSIIEPNAMCLSTATKNGVPSARFVLCKGVSRDGFKFFTHYTSRKGTELSENPNCALTFFWAPISRSVRIEGVAEKLPLSEAEDYFNGRPYQSQIGALCSDQSRPVTSRDVLCAKADDLKSKYGENQVPRPPQWGGYIVKPHTIEFWQGQTDRIHDRIVFSKTGEESDGILSHRGEDGWIYTRLCP